MNIDLKTWYNFHYFLTVKSTSDLTKTVCNVKLGAYVVQNLLKHRFIKNVNRENFALGKKKSKPYRILGSVKEKLLFYL